VKPDPLAQKNESMSFLWKLVEFLPRRTPKDGKTSRASLFGWYIPRCEHRWIPPETKIHSSVFERRGTEHDYDQPNIPDSINTV